MPYPLPTLTAIRAAAMSDITAASGQPLLPNSVLGRLAYALSGLVFDLYGYLAWIAKNATPWGATGEYLAAWAALKGVTRLPASPATGTVAFNGTPGIVIPAGSLLSRNDGTQYQTTTDFTIGTTATAPLQAVAAGAAGNAPSATVLALTTPVTGAASSTVALQALTGGADAETDAGLRGRMLYAYAHPPDGGSAGFYTSAALSVSGVTRAWVISQGVSAGSVLVYFMKDVANAATNGFPVGTNGGASAETRIPAATGDQLAVANAILAAGQPVTAVCYVASPTPAPVNISIKGLNPDNPTVEANIKQALSDLFVRVAAPVAGTLVYPSDISAAIESGSGGAGQYVLLSPTGTISTANGTLPVCGTVSFS